MTKINDKQFLCELGTIGIFTLRKKRYKSCHWDCPFLKSKLLSILGANKYISGANMSILGPNMYISGANMYILGPNMNILGPNMNILGGNMYIWF